MSTDSTGRKSYQQQVLWYLVAGIFFSAVLLITVSPWVSVGALLATLTLFPHVERQAARRVGYFGGPR